MNSGASGSQGSERIFPQPAVGPRGISVIKWGRWQTWAWGEPAPRERWKAADVTRLRGFRQQFLQRLSHHAGVSSPKLLSLSPNCCCVGCHHLLSCQVQSAKCSVERFCLRPLPFPAPFFPGLAPAAGLPRNAPLSPIPTRPYSGKVVCGKPLGFVVLGTKLLLGEGLKEAMGKEWIRADAWEPRSP